MKGNLQGALVTGPSFVRQGGLGVVVGRGLVGCNGNFVVVFTAASVEGNEFSVVEIGFRTTVVFDTLVVVFICVVETLGVAVTVGTFKVTVEFDISVAFDSSVVFVLSVTIGLSVVNS